MSGRGARGEGSTPAPIVQLAYEPRERRLWALTPDAVELIDFEPGPARRTAIAAPAPGGRFVDLVADGEGRAFVLDASRREIAAVDAHRRSARVVAQLPVAPSETHAMSAAPRCAGGAAHDEGALALLPDRSALLAATDGALWRIDLRTSAVDAVHLDVPLPHVSQLVPLGADATAHHLAVLRGCANEVVTLHLARDARRGIIDAGTRARFDTPWRGVHDGRDLVVLLGRLRHHPDFGGDGRPNLPALLAAYVVVAPGERPTVAEVR